jgi:ElaB/YqjD/DUF883 family membrane-anchored ribosome-binding protein
MAREFTIEKMDEALDYLNRAAEKKKEQLTKLIDRKYSNVRAVLNGGKGLFYQIRQDSVSALEAGEETLKRTTKEIEHKIHGNPWPFVGGVGITCLLLGYLLRRK